MPTLYKLIGYSPQAGGRPLTGRILVARYGPNCTQFIGENGFKSFLRGSKTAGAYWSTADLPAEEHADLETKINICEGIATALTAYEATGNLSIAVGSCNNLSAVVADVYWGSSITVFADRGNGEAKAEQAARESTSPLVKPVFDPGDKGTDINDMRCLYGMDAVKRCIDSAVVPEIELQVATAFEGPIPVLANSAAIGLPN